MKTGLILFFLSFVTLLEAKTLLSLLKKIENNHTLHMNNKQNSFVCTPYGIDTLTQLLQRSDTNSTCAKYIRDYRVNNPKEQFFAQEILTVQQQYSVEGKKGLCLLYLSNSYTYSESLLSKGYARIKLSFDEEDVALKYRFTKAMQSAKKNSLGIWSDSKIKECFLLPQKK